MSEEQIIFIISQPRAGSTALQLKLGRHDSISTISEPWTLLPLLGLHKPGFLKGVYNHNLYLRTQEELFQIIDKQKYNESLRTFILSHYEQLLKSGTKYFLDKTPRYYEILTEIYSLFPKAQYIILKRHPANVLKSIIQTWCSRDLNKIFGYSRDILLAPKLIQQFEADHKGQENFHVLRYEDFISNSENELAKLFDFLKIENRIANSEKSASEILLGSFGDQKQARNNDQIVNSREDWSDLKNIESKSYRKIVDAYLKYLGKDFLKEYGEYSYKGEATFKRSVLFNKMLKNITGNE